MFRLAGTSAPTAAGRPSGRIANWASCSSLSITTLAAPLPCPRRSRSAVRLQPATPSAPTNHPIISTASVHHRTTRLASTVSEATSPEKPLVHHEGVKDHFQRLGLNDRISTQLATSYPHIRAPTPAQRALIPAILSPADLILRAHTGTGKSFGILLALLAKPRIVFKDLDGSPGGRLENHKGKARESHNHKQPATGIASVIIVPSNELAAQYVSWARRLFPKDMLPSLDPVIQCLVRGSDNGLTPEEEQIKLRSTPPHILIGTPGRIKDLLDTPAGSALLGIETLRTLVLDEADAILQLPGRFPGQKQKWKHQVHMAPGLEILNRIMKKRATYSGGDRHLTAGLENRPGKRKDERRPPEHIRRHAYKAAENPDTGLAAPRPRVAGVQPLQLVCTSATANSVMRHFFGARSGWLRTGAKESDGAGATRAGRSGAQTGRWIDLTGLSGQSMVESGIKSLLLDTAATSHLADSIGGRPTSLPAGIEHTCVVVDEAPLSRRLERVPLRNLAPKLAKRRPDKYLNEDGDEAAKAAGEESEAMRFGWEAPDEFKVVKPPGEPAEHEMDQTLIEALAFCFASEGTTKGLALIPPRWSLLKTRAALETLGLTVRLAGDTADGDEDPHLYLLQSTSARGLDLPGLTHVFLLGFAAVIDAVQYTHMAGRVARIGSAPAPWPSPSASIGGATLPQQQADRTPRGKVITLLRGIPHDYTEEAEPFPAPQSATPGKGDDQQRRATKTWISSWELKMGNVYRRLGLVPRKLDLHLLKMGEAAMVEEVLGGAETEPGPEAEVAPEVEAEVEVAAPSSPEGSGRTEPDAQLTTEDGALAPDVASPTEGETPVGSTK